MIGLFVQDDLDDIPERFRAKPVVLVISRVLRTSSDKAYIFPSWHDYKHQIFKLP